MLAHKFFSAALGTAARRAAALGAVMMATVLTNGGEQWACDRMSGVSALNGGFGAWGTGAGTAAKADATLFTEASEARVAATITTNGTGAAAKYQAVWTIVADAVKTITNGGNFTASTAGILIIKGDFTGTLLALGESITFTATLDPS